ncbi:hypothetical protein AJ88_15865 [Mesorhizobium amorphae CCBAU 01583]|nr:hypothetical protein AJ88_15865 [Mesorhizobium amorphae CCBAU 01583]
MYNLDEAARSAAANGGSPLFRLPEAAVIAGAEAPIDFGAMTPAEFVASQLAKPDVGALGVARGGEGLARSMAARLQVVLDRYEKMAQ